MKSYTILLLLLWSAGIEGNLDSGLVGYWKFDEAGGEAAYDSSGNENTGRIAGGIRAESFSGSSLELDGLNDYVEVNHSPELNPAEGITVSIWVYLHGYPESSAFKPGKEVYLFAKEGVFEVVMMTGIYGSGIVFYPKGQTGGVASFNTDLQVQELVELNKWHHVIAAYSATEEGALYVDGTLQGTHSGDPIDGWPAQNVTSLFLGAMDRTDYTKSENLNRTVRKLDGRIDECRIYNRTLAPEEIQDLSNARDSLFPRVGFLHPEPGLEASTGDTVEIRWEGNSLLQDENVRFALYDSTGKNLAYRSNILVPNTGSYYWVIPLLETGTYTPSLESPSGLNLGFAPKIRLIHILRMWVIHPTAETIFEPNAFHALQWYSTLPDEPVKIEYTLGDSVWSLIAEKALGDTEFYWYVPDTMTSTAKIRISEPNSGISAISEEFEIGLPVSMSYETNPSTLLYGQNAAKTYSAIGRLLITGTSLTEKRAFARSVVVRKKPTADDKSVHGRQLILHIKGRR